MKCLWLHRLYESKEEKWKWNTHRHRHQCCSTFRNSFTCADFVFFLLFLSGQTKRCSIAWQSAFFVCYFPFVFTLPLSYNKLTSSLSFTLPVSRCVFFVFFFKKKAIQKYILKVLCTFNTMHIRRKIHVTKSGISKWDKRNCRVVVFFFYNTQACFIQSHIHIKMDSGNGNFGRFSTVSICYSTTLKLSRQKTIFIIIIINVNEL